MESLVILMIEAEQPEGLSARKLVVETIKHNVLTAYTAHDGINLLLRFPNVDAVLVHSSLLEQHPEILLEIKKLAADLPIILTSPFGNIRHPDASFQVDSHHPEELLRLLSGEIRPRMIP